MTQKIFDTDNAEDMADLWDILPDDATVITKGKSWDCLFIGNDFNHSIRSFLSINWHDKTEIIRPIQEATEADVGKLCYFWDNDGSSAYGLLSDLIIKERADRKYGCVYGKRWAHARRLTKQEIEELI